MAALVLLTFAFTVTGGSTASGQEGRRTWLAMGDSYSSGEGIPGTVPQGNDGVNGGRNGQGRDCRRANGQNTDATAWAVGAYRAVRAEAGLAQLHFVACTGAITDEAVVQAAEARRATRQERWDLVTFSFGGNNIGFADVLKACLDVNGWGAFDLTPGCDVTERQLRRRIDMLVGRTPLDADEYQASGTFPELLDLVGRNDVNTGGDVVVVGYPHLIEEVDRWSSWTQTLGHCHGILAADVGMLRSATGYLNEQLALAVASADRRFRDRGIRFHFLDISRDPYEAGRRADDRHGLCSSAPWLNGVTPGTSSGDFWEWGSRSFHPFQAGHTATADVLASFIRDNVRFDDGVVALTASGSGVAEVAFEEPAGSLSLDLPAVLGRPDEDTGWHEIDCLPGDPARERTLRWDGFSVTFIDDPARWPQPVLNGWLVDFAAGGVPTGVVLQPDIDGSVTGADLTERGAAFDDFYGTWELDGLTGMLTSRGADPAATVQAVGAGVTGLLGC